MYNTELYNNKSRHIIMYIHTYIYQYLYIHTYRYVQKSYNLIQHVFRSISNNQTKWTTIAQTKPRQKNMATTDRTITTTKMVATKITLFVSPLYKENDHQFKISVPKIKQHEGKRGALTVERLKIK